MKAGRVHSLVNLALSLVVFAISLGVALFSVREGSLFADRPDAAASLEVASGR